MLFTTAYAFFGAIDLWCFLITTLVASSGWIAEFKSAKSLFFDITSWYKSSSAITRISFGLGIIVPIAYSSGYPILADNESYYIQTIKWLNEFGFVRGLANWHPFLAQNSGWHILQAALNFSFISPNFNDINGYLIIVITLMGIRRIGPLTLESKFSDGLLFVPLTTLPFWFLFAGSPSPDLPLILLTPIIVSIFLRNESSNIALLSFLIGSLIFIKVTIAPIALFLLPFLINNGSKKAFVKALTLPILFAGLFIGKNLLLSGYPLFPLNVGADLFSLEWSMNPNLKSFIDFGASVTGWEMGWIDMSKVTPFAKLYHWITLEGYKGIMNRGAVAVLLLFPIVVRNRSKKMNIIYLVAMIQFIILLGTSPQFRFWLPLILTLTFLIAIQLVSKRVFIIHYATPVVLATIFILNLIKVDVSRFSSNQIMQNRSPLELGSIVEPKSITQFPELMFRTETHGDITYYLFDNPKWLWQTSNGPLPCANLEMMQYLDSNLGHQPKSLGTQLGDGFKY